MLAYESRLNTDPRWALSEGSRHFEERSAVQDTLRRLAQRLNDLGVPYAIAGGMALFQHGLRRFTEDVSVLVTRDGHRQIHDSLSGLGYLPAVQDGKNLRDTQTGVRIDFLITGDYPGDGEPKPVTFPDPGAGRGVPADGRIFERDGIRYLGLASLIELKLASGMTSPSRLRDLSDVLELIRILDLPASFADELDSYVRPKFIELRDAAGSDPGEP